MFGSLGCEFVAMMYTQYERLSKLIKIVVFFIMIGAMGGGDVRMLVS